MTTSDVSSTTTTEKSPTEQQCLACGHPMTRHDALGRRFCAATVTSSLERGCICAK
jgi:hypothetical protein